MIEQVIREVRDKKQTIQENSGIPIEISTIAALKVQVLLDADIRSFHIIELYENQFSCDIYRITANLSSIVIAQDKDKNNYWLDCYGNNEDFGKFVSLEYRSGKLQPLLQDVSLIAQFLVDTKLNYMPLPKYIIRPKDIPNIGDTWTNSNSLVTPAQIKHASEAVWEIDFNVWTKQFGYLLGITCKLSPDKFTHQASTIIKGVGRFARHL